MNGRTNVTTGANTDILEVPLDPVTNFVAKPGNSKVELSWTDPKDKYATPEGEAMEDTDQLVSKWSYTKVIRKENVAPIGPNDGVEIISSQVRNEYQDSVYADTSIENGHSYYYAVITYNEQDVASELVVSDETIPKLVSSVLNENTWDVIDMIASQGLAQSYWEIGDETNEFTIGSETHSAVILDFNHDGLADGSGKAAITFSLKGLMKDKKQMNSSGISSSPSGGWAYPNISNVLRPYIENTIYGGLQNDLKSYIQKVTRNYGYGDSNYDSSYYGTSTTSAYLFPFTTVEVGFSKPDSGSSGNHQSQIKDGSKYPYFSSNTNRVKNFPDGTAGEWWLGSGNVRVYYNSPTALAYYVSSTGDRGSWSGYTGGYLLDARGVCFGFCIGKSAA